MPGLAAARRVAPTLILVLASLGSFPPAAAATCADVAAGVPAACVGPIKVQPEPIAAACLENEWGPEDALCAVATPEGVSLGGCAGHALGGSGSKACLAGEDAAATACTGTPGSCLSVAGPATAPAGALCVGSTPSAPGALCVAAADGSLAASGCAVDAIPAASYSLCPGSGSGAACIWYVLNACGMVDPATAGLASGSFSLAIFTPFIPYASLGCLVAPGAWASGSASPTPTGAEAGVGYKSRCIDPWTYECLRSTTTILALSVVDADGDGIAETPALVVMETTDHPPGTFPDCVFE